MVATITYVGIVTYVHRDQLAGRELMPQVYMYACYLPPKVNCDQSGEHEKIGLMLHTSNINFV